jgi:hypothetical protein
MMERFIRFKEDVVREGSCLSGAQLAHEKEATRVKVRHGKRTVLDGPFMETKETLGGYFVVDCASPEDAVALAARCPGAELGIMEVRPVFGGAEPMSHDIEAPVLDGRKGPYFAFLIQSDERDEGRWTAAMNQIASEQQKFDEVLKDGVVDGHRLERPSLAKRVSIRAGRRHVVDGPFLETKEILGGFVVVRCKDKSEAVELAGRIPPAFHGTVEVRPVVTR